MNGATAPDRRFAGLWDWLMAALALMALAPFLYAFAFCYPQGDDFDGVTRAMFLLDLPGALYEVAREWLTWSGRYTYHFLAVFLGAAGTIRPVYGLVCCAVLCVYGLGCVILAGPGLRPKSSCILFAPLGMLCFCSAYGQLPNLYILTDALTICLQGGLFLLYMGMLLRTPTSRATIACGILAIGVYEHAALAVICLTGSFLLALWLPSRLSGKSADSDMKRLCRMFCWLCGCLLFSFLAPGNFHRKSARADSLAFFPFAPEQIFSDWLHTLADFFNSPLIICALILGLLMRAGRNDEASPASRGLFYCLLALLGWTFFSIALVSLHAFSDAPFSTTPKIGASLHFYTALCTGLLIYFLPLPRLRRIAPRLLSWLRALGSLCLIAFCCQQANFKNTLANAANGELLVLASFMKQRGEAIAAYNRQHAFVADPFGLYGELLVPGVRERKNRVPDDVLTVLAFPRQVFPVLVGGQLSDKARDWPNVWAAWTYGLPGIRAVSPAPERALKKLDATRGQPLFIPEALENAGIASAWLLEDEQGLWLIFRGDFSASKLYILRPNPPACGRLMPLPLQRLCLEKLAASPRIQLQGWLSLCCAPLLARLEPHDGLAAFWLGPAMVYAPWPKYFFASVDNMIYDLVRPMQNSQ